MGNDWFAANAADPESSKQRVQVSRSDRSDEAESLFVPFSKQE